MTMKNNKPTPNAFRIAARVYAKANRSDPFAYGRMIAWLVQGIEHPAEVISDWHRLAHPIARPSLEATDNAAA